MAEVKLEQIELLEQSVKYKITSSLPILNIDYSITSGMTVMTKTLMIPEGTTEYTHNIAYYLPFCHFERYKHLVTIHRY